MKTLRNLGGTALILALSLLACTRKPAASQSDATPRSAGASYELRLGNGIYVHYCQTCHGETGGGDGFNAFNLDPRPRDLSSPAFQKTKSDADLADAVRRGGAGVGLSPLMPPWGHTFSARQIDSVILYLRSLQKSPGPAPAADQTPRSAPAAAS